MKRPYRWSVGADKRQSSVISLAHYGQPAEQASTIERNLTKTTGELNRSPPGLRQKRKLNGIYERSPGGGLLKTPYDVLNLALG